MTRGTSSDSKKDRATRSTATSKKATVSKTQAKSPAKSAATTEATVKPSAPVGFVSFVGSGPGDPELLTVRAVELLRAAEVDAGDTIEFTLEPDTASREPDLPEEMRKAFQARPALEQHWLKHSVAQRRQVVRYILQAKSAEVQAKRSWLFLERLAETGSLSNPDYPK